jgi:hypothetical protein
MEWTATGTTAQDPSEICTFGRHAVPLSVIARITAQNTDHSRLKLSTARSLLLHRVSSPQKMHANPKFSKAYDSNPSFGSYPLWIAAAGSMREIRQCDEREAYMHSGLLTGIEHKRETNGDLEEGAGDSKEVDHRSMRMLSFGYSDALLSPCYSTASRPTCWTHSLIASNLTARHWEKGGGDNSLICASRPAPG